MASRGSIKCFVSEGFGLKIILPTGVGYMAAV